MIVLAKSHVTMQIQFSSLSSRCLARVAIKCTKYQHYKFENGAGNELEAHVEHIL